MALTSYSVLAFFAYMAHTCNANSVQIAGGGTMIRAEIEKHSGVFPKWEKYFKSLENLTFVKIGSKKGLNNDPIYTYAKKHSWKGLAIEPNPVSFKALQANYLHMNKTVTPLQMAVSDKDSVDVIVPKKTLLAPTIYSEDSVLPVGADAKEEAKDAVKSVTLQSLWKQNVIGKFNKVDILAIDVSDADSKELKLMTNLELADPKPQFILFPYSHLNRRDYRAMGTNLEENGYKYVGRDGEDQLHQLIHHDEPAVSADAPIEQKSPLPAP
jgi:FkbM family methyltransferase